MVFLLSLRFPPMVGNKIMSEAGLNSAENVTELKYITEAAAIIYNDLLWL